MVIDLGPGERIGDWIVGEPLGRGGMATVYRCHSALSARLTGALKIVESRPDPAARGRFVREIETLASLRHQAIIRVLSAGEDTQRGLLYLVMELIEGEDLAQRLGREALSWRDAARIFRDVADGLMHAHEVGVHHRDIKPANVMITREGGGVLVDFGIALDQERTRLTEIGMVPGTVAYMPPELLLSDSRSVDPALADVYAFGLVFFEALGRQRAFPGFQQASRNDLIRLVQEKLDHEPFDPGDVAPQALRGLVKGCTQPTPLKRPRMKGVVRMLDLALAPTPGVQLASRDEGDEPTMVMNPATFESPPTFAVDQAATPAPAAESRRGTPRFAPPRVDPPLAPAPFDEGSDPADSQQSVDRAAIRTELDRRRRRAKERPTALLWGTAFGMVLLLAFLTGSGLLLVWWVLS